MSEPLVRYAVSDGIAEIILARPPVNAINVPLLDELIAAYRRAAQDRSAHAVLLRSAFPDRFSGGFDLELARNMTGVALRAALQKLYMEMFDAQYRLGKPTIAVVAGAARGAGMTLAICCDMIVAADSATFGYSEIDIGFYPGVHCVHLPRIIGRHRAFELLFSGRSFSAAEAQSMGLINRIAPAADLLAAAREFAAAFTGKSPLVMQMGRDAFMRANDLDYRRTIETMAETLCNVVETPDAREGFAAFLEKRAPDWPSNR
jgi:enoyl-CoA hydratase